MSQSAIETFIEISSGAWINKLKINKLYITSLSIYFNCRIVQGEEAIRHSSMASINATVQVPRLKMTRVHIPFTFRLLETGNNSYEGKWVKKLFQTNSHIKQNAYLFGE